MHTKSIVQAPSLTLASGITIPDSKMAREVTELVRDTENSLLFNHSSRVYYFSAATGKRKGLTFDPELLYVSAMFHDLGLTPKHSSATDRFEVDGANAAREFLRQHNIPGSGANFKKGRRADPGALGERESFACQIGPKLKLCTRSSE